MKNRQSRWTLGRKLATRVLDILRPWVGRVWAGGGIDRVHGGRRGIRGLLRGLFGAGAGIASYEGREAGVGMTVWGLRARGTGGKQGRRRGRQGGAMALDPMEARVLLSAVVITDKADYAPGSTALFTATTDGGSVGNFQAGETVRFEVTRVDGTPVVSPAVGVWNVTDGATGFGAYQDADGAWWMPDLDGVVNGTVQTAWAVDAQFANTAEHLTATGVTSGVRAETGFTDSVTSITIGAQTGALTAGTGGLTTYTITFARDSNNPSYSGLAVSGLPAGVSASLSATSGSASGNNDLPPVTLTLTSTTGALAGTFSFTVSSTSPSLSSNGTVVVTDATAPATASVTNPVNGSILRTGTVPATFTGSVADSAGGLGLNANSTTFRLRRGDGQYWTGSAWQVAVFNLTTTHGTTSSGSSTTWTSAATMPNWLTVAEGTITVQATATDKSGNSFSGSVVSFTFDRTAPVITAAVVNDGLSGDVNVQASAAAISANWSGFTDAGSGIASYAMSIGTSPGGGQVQGFVTVGNVTSATVSGLSLVSGTTYYVTIRATDAAGNTSSVNSNGVAVDTGAPTSAATSVTPFTNSGTFSVSYSASDSISGLGSVELWAKGPADGSFSLVATDSAPVSGNTFIYTATQGAGSYAFYTRALDAAGNYEAAPGSADTTTVYDVTAPTVTSINRVGGATSNGATVSWTVVFSEAVAGVDVNDFALVATGVTGAAISNVAGSGTTYTVTASTGTGSGTLHLNAVDDDTVMDAAGNRLGGTGAGNGGFTAGQDITIDKTGPLVSSIVRVGASPTNAGSVQWTVTFNESVTGVGTADFTLARSGSVVGGSVTTVSGSGTTYTVTATTGTGDGTLGLNVLDDDTIVDALGNKLGGTGLGNGNYSGEVYSIDKTVFGPSIGGPASGSYKVGTSLNFTLNFGENVFVTGTPQIGVTIGASVVNAAYLSGSGTGSLVFRYVVQAGDTDSDGISTASSIALNGGTISDAAGNAAVLTFTPPVTTGVLVDTTAPVAPVISGISLDTGLSGGDRVTSDTTLHLTGTAEAGSTVAVTRVGVGVIGTVVATGGVWDFDYTGTTLAQGSHSFTATAADAAGNISAASAALNVVVDTAAPAAPGVALASDTGVSSGDLITNNGGLTVSGLEAGALVEYSIDGGGSWTGSFAAVQGLNSVKVRQTDVAGNVGAASAALVFTLDTAAPGANSIVRQSPAGQLSNGSGVTFLVSFSEAVSGVAAGNFVVSGTAGAGTVGTPTTGDGGLSWSVPVTGLAAANGTVQLNLGNNTGIADIAGNGLSTASLSGAAYTLDHVSPSVASIVGVGAGTTAAASVQWTVTFSESVSGVSAADFVLATTGVAGAVITDVSGSGATYTVTASTGTGNGTIGLNAVDDDSVTDAVGNVLGGSGAGNGNFSGDVFAVVKNVAPTATVSLSSTSPTTNAVLTATATRADLDGDSVQLTYVWKVNGVVKQTTVKNAFDGTDLTDTFDLSVAGQGNATDLVTVEVTPFDGTISGAMVSQGATVVQDTPTVTALWTGGAYNGGAFAAGGTVRGFGGEDLGLPTFTYYAGAAAVGTPLSGAPVHAGTYTVVAHFGGTAEYAAASSAPATIVIARAVVSYTIGNASHVYGSTADLGGVLTTTFATGVNGESLSIGGYASAGNTAVSHVNSYAITGVVSDGAGVNAGLASDYDLTVNAGVLSVSKASLSHTIGDNTHAYGSTVALGGATIDGVNGETLDVSYSSAGNTVAAHVGNYAITGVVADGTGAASDYDVAITSGQLAVSRYALSYQIGNASHVYGSTVDLAAALGTSLVTGVNGESLGISYSSAGNTATSGAGNFAITGTLSGASGAVSDYDVTLNAGTLTVTQASLTITASSGNKVYGDTVTFAGTEFTADGLLNSDDVDSVSLSSLGAAGTTGVAGSPYGITASGAVGTGLGNYDIHYVSGALAVQKAHLTVSADAQSKVFGAANPPLTATIAGFVNGELLGTSGVTGSLVVSTTAEAASGAGTYAITVSAGDLAAENYDFTGFAAGTLTVTKAASVVQITWNDSTYSGLAHAAVGNVTGAGGLSVGASSLTYYAGTDTSETAVPLAGAPVNAGTYTVVATYDGDADHTGDSASKTITIAKAAATVVVTGFSGVYDGAAHGAAGSAVGANGEPLSGLSIDGTTYVGVGGGTVHWAFSNANYADQSGDALVVITKSHLSITAQNKLKVYGDATPSLTYTLGGFVAGEDAASANVTGAPVLGTAADTASGVGGYAIDVTGGTLTAMNYDFTSFVSGTLTVNARAITITAGSTSKTYGQTVVFTGGEFSISDGTLVNGDSVDGVTLTSAGAAASAGVAASPYAIVASAATGTGLTNYVISFVNGSLTVNKAHLVVTADSKSKAFGSPNPALTATITGFVNAESLVTSGVTGSPALSTDATDASAVGGYPITAALNDLAAANYDFTSFVPGTLTVSAEASITTVTWAGWTYDGTAHAATATVTGAGGLETTAGDIRYYSGLVADAAHLLPGAPTHAGTYTVVATYAGDANHASSTDSMVVTVAKAAAVITVTPFAVDYEGTQHVATGTAVGVQGEALAGLDLSGTAHTNAGNYTGDVWTFTDVTGNYEDASGTVDSSIAKVNAVIQVAGFTGAYSGTAHGASGSATGVAGVDLTGHLHLGDSFTDVPGGTANWTFDGDQNYNAAGGSVAIAISQAPSAIHISWTGWTYDGTAHAATATVTGVGTPVGSATFVYYHSSDVLRQFPLAGAPVNAGTYDVVAHYAGDVNHNASDNTASVTVAARALSVTADGKAKTYGAADPVLTYLITAGSLVAGESLTGAISRDAGEDVGTYAISRGTLDAGSNYDLTFVDALLTVGQKGLLVTVNNLNITYGDTPTFGVSYGGFINSEGPGDLGGTLAFVGAGTHAGDYVISASGLTSSNYAISYATGTLTVGRKGLVISVDDASKVFGSANPAFAVGYAGFIPGEDAGALSGTLIFDTAATTTSDVGSYPVSASGQSSQDYQITYVPGTLTVTQALSVTTITWANGTYTGAAHAAAVSVTGAGGLDTAATTITYYVGTDTSVSGTVLGTPPVNAGTYTVVATYDGDINHAASFSAATITIAKAIAAIDVQGFTGVYTGSPRGASGTATGVTGENLASLLSLGGTFTNVPGGSAHWTFAGNANYAADSGDVAITITQAVPTIAVSGFNGTYDGQPHGVVSGSATGVNGEPLTGLSIAADTFVNVSGGVIHWTFTNPNYISQSGDATVAIAKAHLTVTADNRTKVFGDGNPSLTASITGFVPGDDLASSGITGSADVSTTAGAASAVGSYPIAVSGGDLAADNYDFTSFVPGILTVTKATSATHITWTGGIYNGTARAATATATGAGGLDVAVPTLTYYAGTDTSATGTILGGPPLHAGTYSVVATYAGDDNHFGSSTSATITIAVREITVTANQGSKVFGVADPALTYSVSTGSLAGTDTLSGELSRDPGDAVGTYPIVQGTLSVSSDYALSFVGNTFTIAQNASTVEITWNDTTYDGAAHPAAATVSGAGTITGTPTLTYYLASDVTFASPLSGAPVNAGSYTVVATYAGDANHAGSTNSATITIAKADAVIHVTGYTGVYDGSAHGAGGTAAGVESPTPADLSASLDFGGSFTNAGTHSAHWTFTGGTNYNDAQGDVLIDLAKASTTVTVDGGAFAYDAAAHGASNAIVSGAGVIVGTPSFAYYLASDVTFSSPLANAPINAGDYAVIATFAGDVNHTGSSSGPVAIAITKVNATLHVTGYTGIYDGAAHGASGTATGVSGEDLASLLSLGGTYTNVPGGTAHWVFAGNENYNATAGDAAIVITQATATITVTGFNGTYDGQPHGVISSAVTGVNGETPAGLSIDTTTFTNALGGTVHWTFSNLNYASQSGDTLVTITKAHLTVTAENSTKIFGQDNPSFTAAITGFVPGETLANSGVTGAPTLATAAVGASPVGSYEITVDVGTLAAENYDFTTLVSGTLSITPATSLIRITWNSGTYTGTANAATATATGAGGLNVPVSTLTYYLGTDTSATGTTLAGPPVDAGTYTVVATYDGDHDHTGSTASKTITIAKADASISVIGFTGVYTGTAHGASGGAIGVTSENLAALLDLGTSFTNVPGGTAHWTFAGNNNYNAASGDVAITITQAVATIAVPNFTGTYDGQPHGVTGSSATGINGETLTGLLVDGDTFTNAPGGTVHWTFSDLNYATQSGDALITITKAHLTVTSQNQAKLFGDSNPALTAVITGFVNSETLSSSGVTGTPALATAADAASPVGTYPITVDAGTLAAVNYDFTTFVPGTLTIAQAASTTQLIWNDAIYTGTAHAATATASGAGGLNTPATSLAYYLGTDTGPGGTPLAGPPVNAGTYTVVATYAGDANHTESFAVKTITIAKANATITVTGYTGVYDGIAHGASGTATGVNAEGLSGLLSLGATFTNVPGGTAHWTFAGDTNYATAEGDVQIIITQATATVSVTGFSGTYDGQPHGVIASAVTGVSGETPAGLTIDATTFVNVSGGLVHWTFSNPNYTSQSGDAVVTITRAHLTVTADNQTKVFGQPNPTFTAQITGFVTGETLLTSGVTGSPTLSTAADASSPVGCYAINVVLNTLAAQNYDFTTFTPGSLVITQAVSLTQITWTDAIYTGTAHAASATATGAGGLNAPATTLTYYIGTDTSATGTTLASPPINAGTYTVVATYTGDVNHTGSSAVKTITIAKAAATIDVQGYTGIYDRTAHGATGTATGVIGEDLSNLLDLGASFTNVPGGTAHWSFTGNQNYNAVAGDVAITITQAQATLIIDSLGKTYGTGNPALAGTLSGILGGDNVTTAYATTATQFSNVGSYAITATLGGAQLPNYNIVVTIGLLTISRATQVITWAAPPSITYGTALSATQLNATVAGVIGGSAAGALTYTPAAGTVLSAGNGQTLHVDAAQTLNYNAASLDVSIDVAKATLTITASAANKSYDGTAAAAVTFSDNRIAGDALTIAYASATFNSKEVGSGKLVTVSGLSISGPAAGNYVLASTSATTTASILAATIQGRRIFYKDSTKFDTSGSNPGNYDSAIATDKVALLTGQTATFANYTSYSRGINGVIVDMSGTITAAVASDFTFRVMDANAPTGWSDAPAPTAIIVRPGAGANGSTRIEFTWANAVIAKTWLQVTVIAGLSSNDVFYFGNAIGDTGNSGTDAKVTPADEILARANPTSFIDPATVTNLYDFNRDGTVSPADQIIARNNVTTFVDALPLITPQPGAGLPLVGSSSSSESDLPLPVPTPAPILQPPTFVATAPVETPAPLPPLPQIPFEPPMLPPTTGDSQPLSSNVSIPPASPPIIQPPAAQPVVPHAVVQPPQPPIKKPTKKAAVAPKVVVTTTKILPKMIFNSLQWLNENVLRRK